MSGHRKRDELAPSLFPFLAVLVCTMGALVLILMLVVNNAESYAKEAAKNDEVEQVSQEMMALSEEMQKVRAKQQQELERQQGELAHIEDHINRLLKQAEDLAKQREKLMQQQSEQLVSDEEFEKAKEDLLKKIAENEEELKKKEEEKKEKKPAYAIIPYYGPNGTQRRPIYLECTAQGLIVQPDGFMLQLRDLQPPYGPGNPLDAVLRSIRSHLETISATGGVAPYPLLIVRPDGIRTYALARGAITSWDDQFGYELVEDDKELKFPPFEKPIRAELEKVVAQARARQVALIAAMPGRMREMLEDSSGGEGWGPIDTDEAVGEGLGGGDGEGNEDGLMAGGDGSGSADEPSLASGSGNSQNPQGGGESRGSNPLANGSRPESFVATTPYGSGGFITGRSGAGVSAGGGSPDGRLPPGTGGMRTVGAPMAGGNALGSSEFGNNQPSGASEVTESLGGDGEFGPISGNSNSQKTAGGSRGSQGTNGKLAQDQQGTTDGQAPGSGDAAEGVDGTTKQKAMAGKSNGKPPPEGSVFREMSGGGDSLSGTPGGEGSPSVTYNTAAAKKSSPRDSKNKSSSQSSKPSTEEDELPSGAIVISQGSDWTRQNVRGTAIDRVIRIHCMADRWVIMAEPKQQGTKTIFLRRGLAQARDDLAKALQSRIDSWGMALAGGYWKPRIVVHVDADAQTRYDQLRRVLQGSGIEVKLTEEADRGKKP
jgi:hypothetical protein